jgi:hypothetical protein
MSFDSSDIRRAMDVYTRDGVYLGVVLSLRAAAVPPLRVPSPEHASSAVSGELLGPMPTQTLGNSGPIRQAAREGFASAPDTALPLQGEIVVGRWYGLLGTWRVPLDAVQAVSMERVVLRLRRDELSA